MSGLTNRYVHPDASNRDFTWITDSVGPVKKKARHVGLSSSPPLKLRRDRDAPIPSG